MIRKKIEPATRAADVAGVCAVARYAGLSIFFIAYLGLRSASPQAICFCPLRGLKPGIEICVDFDKRSNNNLLRNIYLN